MIYRGSDRPRRIRRRRVPSRLLQAAVAAALIFLVSARGLAQFWTDYLWFRSIDLASVWRTLFLSRFLMALIGVVVAASVIWLTTWIANRIRLPGFAAVDEVVARYQEWIGLRARRFGIFLSIGMGLLVGLSASQWWDEALLFANGEDFGITDPVFNHDLSLYVFRVPLLQGILGWLFQLFFLSLLVATVLHYLNGGIRIQRGIEVDPGVKVHLSVMLAVLALLKAGGYVLASYGLLYSGRGAAFGATYTDVNAQLPAFQLLTLISILAAVLLLVNIRVRGWTLPAVAGGLWLAVSVLGGGVYPALIQRFRVEPEEIERESPYIQRHIVATRAAYGLDQVVVSETTAGANLDSAAIARNRTTINNVRLWEPTVLSITYTQQALKNYYKFSDVDVDRYQIGGRTTQVMLAGRELDESRVDVHNWVNDHLVYTHGFGVVVSQANTATSEGLPDYLVEDIPLKSSEPDLTLSQPRIYFGEFADDPTGTDFVIVATEEKEVDGVDAAGNPVFDSYAGNGGVPAGGLLRRAAFALRFLDFNTLISGRVTPDSRVLMRRHIRDQIAAAAPLLYQDSDPYLVLEGGRLLWVVDLYTVTDRYPYAQPAETDRLSVAQKGSLPDSFNYIRNSAKAVVDAYDGTLTLYVVDESDPVIRTYRKIFPKLFSADPPSLELKSHFRYPEELFRVQGDMYQQYHVTDARVFFNDAEPWAVAIDRADVALPPLRNQLDNDAPRPTLPYYLLMKLPGQEEASFVIAQPFSPEAKPNMVSFLVANSDPEAYGDMLDLRFTAGNPPDGPSTVSDKINQNREISQEFTLLDQKGSAVQRGRILVVPVEESLFYVQPIFVSATQGGVPELKQVVVVHGSREVMRPTFADALAAAVGGGVPTVPPDGGEGEVPDDVAGLLAQAQASFAAAEAALRAGDLTEYASRIEEAERLVSQAVAALAEG